jgi:hypothetical protein
VGLCSAYGVWVAAGIDADFADVYFSQTTLVDKIP